MKSLPGPPPLLGDPEVDTILKSGQDSYISLKNGAVVDFE
jgi:hypothetical protein